MNLNPTLIFAAALEVLQIVPAQFSSVHLDAQIEWTCANDNE